MLEVFSLVASTTSKEDKTQHVKVNQVKKQSKDHMTIITLRILVKSEKKVNATKNMVKGSKSKINTVGASAMQPAPFPELGLRKA